MWIEYDVHLRRIRSREIELEFTVSTFALYAICLMEKFENKKNNIRIFLQEISSRCNLFEKIILIRKMMQIS